MDLYKFIGKQIKSLRKSRGMDQQALAERMNTSRVTISRYESGVRKANQDFLFKMINIFNVNADYFFPKINSFKTINKKEVRQIPLIGAIAYGSPLLSEENIDGYISIFCSDKYKNDVVFALKCKDKSMWPDLNDGDLVFVKKQSTVEEDKIAAVLVDSNAEITFRRIKHINNEVLLMPDNINDFSPLTLSKNNHCTILGKVIESSRRF